VTQHIRPQVVGVGRLDGRAALVMFPRRSAGSGGALQKLAVNEDILLNAAERRWNTDRPDQAVERPGQPVETADRLLQVLIREMA
jgi:hypothetical protein